MINDNLYGGSGNEKKITAVYEEPTAINNHSRGEFLYVNNVVCKVTAAITAGDTIQYGAGGNVTDDIGATENTAIWVNGVPGQGTGEVTITSGTTDLTPGTSPLKTGDIYLVYE